MISYSKTDKQVRYKFSIFEDFKNVELQKALHLLRLLIDKNYYYDKKTKEECIYTINKALSTLNLNEDERIEMERKAFYHLSKHIILKQDEVYNIKDVYLQEW